MANWSAKAAGAPDAVGMHVEAGDFRRVLLASKEFDANLTRELRKAIRKSGESLVQDMRANIERIPSQGKHNRGLRAALKKGTRVAIQTGGSTGRGAGIRITTSAKGFPAGAMNMRDGTMRHPVYANAKKARGDWKWVGQSTRPYFGAVVYAHYEDMRNGIREALEDAARQMAADVEH